MQQIPADRLLLETDAPYLLPRTLQPKPSTRRNEPRYLVAVLKDATTVRNLTPDIAALHSLVSPAREPGEVIVCAPDWPKFGWYKLLEAMSDDQY